MPFLVEDCVILSHLCIAADHYYRLFDAIISGQESKLGHGREGYYFVESGEESMYDVMKGIGEALVALGKINDTEPTEYTQEELKQYLMSDAVVNIVFANMRCRADRARQSLGWTPKYTAEDMLKSLPGEVKAIVKKSQNKAS